jgi:hypothetical protein
LHWPEYALGRFPELSPERRNSSSHGGQERRRLASVAEVPHYRGVVLERTSNQEGRLGDVFTLDRRGLDRLSVDPAFRRPSPGTVGDSARKRAGGLDDH